MSFGASRGSSRPIMTTFIAILTAMGLGFGMTGCAGSSGSAASLVVGATAEPSSLDLWHVDGASIPQVLLYNVYQTLVKVDGSGKLQPSLAERWEASSDGKSYTFTLNPAAKFTSGKPVDAQAVVANIKRLKSDPKLISALSTKTALISSADVVAPNVVRINLARPSLMWLYDMTSTVGIMLDPSFSGDLGNATGGSGPYVVGSQAKGQSLTLTKAPQYWGTPARFTEVTFRYFLDPNAMTAAMASGELDVISNLQAPDSINQFSDTSRFTTISGSTAGEVTLGLNHQNAALANLKVRQALTMAIDRKALRDTIWNGQGALIGTMDVPTDPWYEDLSGMYPYNPTKAKELLKEAGFANGLTLRMRVPNFQYASKGAAFVSSQLRDIGVTVKIDELPMQTWLDDVLHKKNYDMTIVAHIEPRDLGMFADKSYYWQYNSPQYQKLYAAADGATDGKGVARMKKAARYLANDAAAIWLFVLPNLVITKADITGVPQNATALSFDLTAISRR